MAGAFEEGADRCARWLADSKVIYRRYASLFFVTGVGQHDNELITLEIIHRFVQPSWRLRVANAHSLSTCRYVEVLDRYFGNVRLLLARLVATVANPVVQVCELDL